MEELIRFSQRCEPPLKAGTYRLEVKQVTDIPCKLASEMTDITVAPERFRLPPDQIYSVYPPREAVGSYADCLPHIVLNRRTLPWEKTLLPRMPAMPWLALLVFDETEGIEVTETTIEAALQGEEGIFVPSLVRQSYEKPDAPCTYIQIPAQLAADILPYADALSLLAHGKGVSLDLKVTDAAVKDDWFAAVVANRFSLEPEAGERAIRHTACLVSLEGYEAWLSDEQGRKAAMSGFGSVRMIALANWSYSMAKADFDFASTFSSLDTAMLTTPYDGDNVQIKQLCSLGCVPMNHQIRDGSQTVSWYQSPLVPYEETKENTGCARFADQLLAYDPALGMMDIRYASAWQIGKSMAFADPAFAHQLYAWRQSNEKLARTSVYHGLLQLHLTNSQAEASIRDWSYNASIGQPFLHAARGNERERIRSRGHQVVTEQLNERYKSMLSEVIADAGQSGLGERL